MSTTTQTNQMLRQYVETALWSTLDYGRIDESWNNLHLDDSYSFEDLPPGLMDEMHRDCEAFSEANAADLDTYYERLGFDAEQAGHDLWLTRENHGTGFWDRYHGNDAKLADALRRLTAAAETMGEFGDRLNDGLA